MNIDIEEMKRRLALGQFNLFEVTNLIEENYRIYEAFEDATNKLQAAESKLEEMNKAQPIGEVEIPGDGRDPIFYVLNVRDDLNEYRHFMVYEHPVAQSNADKENIEQIIKAVAHIGVDFGYGEYQVEQHIIDLARKIHTESVAQ